MILFFVLQLPRIVFNIFYQLLLTLRVCGKECESCLCMSVCVSECHCSSVSLSVCVCVYESLSVLKLVSEMRKPVRQACK